MAARRGDGADRGGAEVRRPLAVRAQRHPGCGAVSARAVRAALGGAGWTIAAFAAVVRIRAAGDRAVLVELPDLDDGARHVAAARSAQAVAGSAGRTPSRSCRATGRCSSPEPEPGCAGGGAAAPGTGAARRGRGRGPGRDPGRLRRRGPGRGGGARRACPRRRSSNGTRPATTGSRSSASRPASPTWSGSIRRWRCRAARPRDHRARPVRSASPDGRPASTRGRRPAAGS